jgi:hypothetical protein
MWCGLQDAYLKESLTVTSSGDARKLLKHFEGFVSELGTMRDGVFPELQKTGAFLAAEKYEGIATVNEREAGLVAGFDALKAQGDKNEPVLQDSLKRETYHEGVVGNVDVHKDIAERLAVWTTDSLAYVEAKEVVESTQEARIQLSTVDGFDVAVKDMVAGNVARLNELGNEIRDAEYKTDISEWRYESPEDVSKLEATIAASCDDITSKAAIKRKVPAPCPQHTTLYAWSVWHATVTLYSRCRATPMPRRFWMTPWFERSCGSRLHSLLRTTPISLQTLRTGQRRRLSISE